MALDGAVWGLQELVKAIVESGRSEGAAGSFVRCESNLELRLVGRVYDDNDAACSEARFTAQPLTGALGATSEPY